jgi:Fur family ferric uptake transcriptional regulator
MVETWAQEARATVRRAGHRGGGARAAVIDLLAQQECCLTAQEIFDRLRAGGRHVGIASVYRALDLLSGLRVVQRLEMGDGVARYEPARADHHHPLVCDACGKVTAFEDPSLEDALTRLADRLEYAVGGHDVTLRGACPDCR